MRTTFSLAVLLCGLSLAPAQTTDQPPTAPAQTTDQPPTAPAPITVQPADLPPFYWVWEDWTDLPWVIRAQDLPEDFRAYHMVIRGEGDGGFTRLFMTMMGAEAGMGGANLLGLSNLFWMRPGIRAGSHWVYAYRFDFMDMMPMLGGMPGMPGQPEVKLRLHRIRIDDISVFSARPDVTRDHLLASLAGGAPPAVELTPAAARTQTISNAQQAALGLLMYAADFDDVFPYVQSTPGAQEVTHPYVRSLDVWTTHNPNGGRLLMNMAVAGVKSTAIEQPNQMPLLFESHAWPDGSRVVAFTDGHSRFVTAAEWEQIQPKLRARLAKTGRPLPAALGTGPRLRALPRAVG